jgi:hypothetical protein
VPTTHGWLVTVIPWVAWLLFIIYLLIIFLYSWMLVKIWPSSTEPKWDPTCIVDQLAFFHGSNVLGDFEFLELNPDTTAQHILSGQTYRLGYWGKGVTRKIWYEIGRTNRGSRKPRFEISKKKIC